MNLTQTAVINGHDIKNMLLGAYAAFAAGYRQIDELNVFPVPDGDTGTNMSMTIGTAAAELKKQVPPLWPRRRPSMPPRCCGEPGATPASSCPCCSGAWPSP